MKQYQLTTHAKQDLIKIRQFTLAHWGTKQSANYLNELQKTLQLISGMPLMGKVCHDIDKNIYRFLYGSHVIYYFNTSYSITIFAILHQSMVPENYLSDRL